MKWIATRPRHSVNDTLHVSSVIWMPLCRLNYTVNKRIMNKCYDPVSLTHLNFM